MDEGWVTALLWLLFGGTHVGLAARPIRSRLVRGLGETGFIALYSIVAIIWVTSVERDPSGPRPNAMEIWYRFPKFVLIISMAS